MLHIGVTIKAMQVAKGAHDLAFHVYSPVNDFTECITLIIVYFYLFKISKKKCRYGLFFHLQDWDIYDL